MLPDKDKTYTQIAVNTVTSYLSFATSTLSSYVWRGNPNERKVSFGQLTGEADQELNRFNNQEQYLETLLECFK